MAPATVTTNDCRRQGLARTEYVITFLDTLAGLAQVI